MFVTIYLTEQGVSVVLAGTFTTADGHVNTVYYIRHLNKPVSFMTHSIFSACLLNLCSSPVFRVFRTRRQKSPDISKISSQEETCQTLASKPAENKHRRLMVSCRQHLPISSRVWTFPPLFRHHAVFIHLSRQPASSEPFSHMWLLSQLQSNGVARRTEAFRKVGKLCLPHTNDRGRQTAAHYSERKISSRFLFPFSVNLCVAVQVFVVPSSSLSTESYLEETKGRIQPVTDGSFAPPSANKWMSVLHEVAQVELMSSVARVKYSDATSLKTTSVLFLLYSTKTN